MAGNFTWWDEDYGEPYPGLTLFKRRWKHREDWKTLSVLSAIINNCHQHCFKLNLQRNNSLFSNIRLRELRIWLRANAILWVERSQVCLLCFLGVYTWYILPIISSFLNEHLFITRFFKVDVLQLWRQSVYLPCVPASIEHCVLFCHQIYWIGQQQNR